MSGKKARFQNIKPSAHDYQHLPKMQKDRYDALNQLDEEKLDRLKKSARSALDKAQTELKLIGLVRRDRSRQQS